ncbi:hypothetical protein PCL_05470 [Purpureocillium lilacinum]|uniref:Sm domain-containing protein n=1 Tax=Purpureocillium lilacinum TaxID=33203 RepID=A0A2U3DUR6_PURLI|nr:hypothetical protein PCL_05470 [Purpureocillium lilacinum]
MRVAGGKRAGTGAQGEQLVRAVKTAKKISGLRVTKLFGPRGRLLAVPSSTTSRRLPIRQPRLAFSSQPTFFAKLHNRNLTIATSIPTSLSPSLLALRSRRQLQLPPATMTSNIGIPIKLLHEATGHIVTVELTNGNSYRGTLLDGKSSAPTSFPSSHSFHPEDSMNVQMKDITVTSREGRVYHVDQVYIRGSHVRFFIIPDMLRNAPMFRARNVRGRGVGLARGRATDAPRASDSGAASAAPGSIERRSSAPHGGGGGVVGSSTSAAFQAGRAAGASVMTDGAPPVAFSFHAVPPPASYNQPAFAPAGGAGGSGRRAGRPMLPL